MDDNALTDIKQEGKKSEEFENFEDMLADDEQQEEAGESSPEDTKTETKPSQEGEEAHESTEEVEDKVENIPDEKPEPFHKHPRWKQMQEELAVANEKAAKAEQLASTPQQVSTEEVEMPQWWITLAGNDAVSQQAYKQYASHNKTTRDEIRQELLEEQKLAQQKANEEEEKWNQWVDSEITSMKEDGLKFNRNKLIKTALDWQPTDDKGQISLRKAYEILKLEENKPSSKQEAQKKVAAKTASDNQGETQPKDTTSSKDLRYKSWESLVQ